MEMILSREQKEFLNRFTRGKWKLNSEGLVDIEGDFDCSYKRLESLHGVRFGKISGYFTCSDNKLTSLEGSPQEVGEYFGCYNNQLTSLEGAPQKVGKNFSCSYNKLITLKGAPREVGRYFYCENNQLASLDGAPQKVGESFYCYKNQLTSLEGAPKKYEKMIWSEGGKLFEVPLIEEAIKEGSVLVWELLPGENKSDKLNDFIENDPSKIDQLNFLFDRDWYTPSPYALAIYKAWKRGL